MNWGFPDNRFPELCSGKYFILAKAYFSDCIVSSVLIEACRRTQFEAFEYLINNSSCCLDSQYINDTITDYGITQNILYYIGKGNNAQALSFIEQELEQGKEGPFVLGDRPFLKSAKEYCLG